MLPTLQIHQNDYIEIRSEALGVRAKNFIPLLGLRTRGGGGSAGASRLKAPSGGVKCPGQVAPTTGSLILVSQSNIWPSPHGRFAHIYTHTWAVQ